MATAALLLAAGCSASSDDPVKGRIAGERVGSGAAVRVAYGVNWAAGGEAPVDKSGAFQLPGGTRVATAYVDANGNGAFDRFAEPSGPCEHSGTDWKCSIAFQKTTLYRAITTRGEANNDKTFVFWEDFGPDGHSVASSRVCIDQRCTYVDKPPFLGASDAPVRVFSICGAEGFAPQDATIERDGEKSSVHVARPPAILPDIKIDSKNGLHLRIGGHFDRLLVWGGDVDAETGDVRKVYWTSEGTNIHIETSSSGAHVDIPERLLGTCGKRRCDVVLQLLKVWSRPDDKIVSETEYRTAVSYTP